MTARIYKPAKTAMQSGTAKTKDWVLDFEPEEPREVEPLMGWTSSGDMSQQVRLRFDTKEEAVAYCERHGIRLSGVRDQAARRAAACPTPTISPSSAATPGPTERRSAAAARTSGAAELRRLPAALAASAAVDAPLAQQRDEALLRHRLAEQEALAVDRSPC